MSDKVNKQLAKARELLLDHDIDPGEYRQIKMESKQKIQSLEAQLFNTSPRVKVNIDAILDGGLAVMFNPEELYFKAILKGSGNWLVRFFPKNSLLTD